MGGHHPRGVMSLEANKRLLAEIQNQLERGSRIVESASFTFNNRNYIVFLQPLDTAIDAQAQKESLIISASIKAADPEKPNFILDRILVDTGSSIDLIYYRTLEKMGLTEMDLMASQESLQSFS